MKLLLDKEYNKLIAEAKAQERIRILELIKDIPLVYNNNGTPFAHWQDIVNLEAKIAKP